ncbi:MAG: energy transducer TonB [Bacteroidales bacterium]|jgi:protein TonB|nr:energy transducer TonB [Bacteroidales bacterium]
MKAKKTKKADLEWKKPVFFQLGVFIALGLMLIMFEITGSKEKEIHTFNFQGELIEDDIILPTKIFEKKVLPPQPASTRIELLKDEENTKEIDNSIFDTEIKEGESIEPYVPVEALPEPEVEDIPFRVVEVNPEFPGGDEALMKYLKDNIIYPKSAIEAGMQGKVMVEFVVERDGSITNVSIYRGKGQILNNEALRVVKSMPKWNPGKQRGKNVRAIFKLPIVFQLQ